MLLKEVMAKHGVTQAALRQVLIQPDGKPLSGTAISQLLSHGIFPKRMAKEGIEIKVKDYLKLRGVNAEDVKAAWDSLATDHTATPNNSSKEFEMSKEILTQTAMKRFGLTCNPFTDDVRGSNDVFTTPENLYILEVMKNAALNGGFMAVVGESGAGKSVLRKNLITKCASEHKNLIFIQPRAIDRDKITAGAVCDSIIYDIAAIDGNTANKHIKVAVKLEDKSRNIERAMTASYKAGFKHCLLIEEAHDLNLHTLRYLKRVNESEHGFERLISVILIGQPELGIKLSERNQDIREVVRRCEVVELQPLGENVQAYLAKKFNRAGVKLSKVFTEDAYIAIQAALPGMTYPLIVNNFVVMLLNQADKINQPLIGAELIAEMVK